MPESEVVRKNAERKNIASRLGGGGSVNLEPGEIAMVRADRNAVQENLRPVTRHIEFQNDPPFFQVVGREFEACPVIPLYERLSGVFHIRILPVPIQGDRDGVPLGIVEFRSREFAVKLRRLGKRGVGGFQPGTLPGSIERTPFRGGPACKGGAMRNFRNGNHSDPIRRTGRRSIWLHCGQSP